VSFDQLCWAIACLLFVRTLKNPRPRDWLLLGLTLGVGLETKYTIVALATAMLLGLLLTPSRRLLRSRWPWLAAGIAVVLLLPNLTWQVSHHWDSVAYTLQHRGNTDGPVLYWLQQLLLVGFTLLPVIVMGTWWLWRQDHYRPAAITIIAVELLFFLAGGKAYYPAPIYTLAYAAGAIWLVDVVRRPWIRRGLVAAAVAFTLVLLPLGLPVLPAQAMANSGLWKVRKDFADMYGWPELSQQVSAVYDGLPAADRGSAMILASNYGEAGALDLYGHGLPPVVSPHLTYYYWAPARMNPSTVIVVGYTREFLGQIFGDIQVAGTIGNAYDLHNDEFGTPIWICRQPRMPLDQAWPHLKALD
jgi:Dolichyl-phosphate-mannose-protein mannosyltransferase